MKIERRDNPMIFGLLGEVEVHLTCRQITLRITRTVRVSTTLTPYWYVSVSSPAGYFDGADVSAMVLLWGSAWDVVAELEGSAPELSALTSLTNNGAGGTTMHVNYYLDNDGNLITLCTACAGSLPMEERGEPGLCCDGCGVEEDEPADKGLTWAERRHGIDGL